MYFMTVPQWYDPDAVREIAENITGLRICHYTYAVYHSS